MVCGSVEDLSVSRWSVVSGRWPVGGRWFCNTPTNSTMQTLQFHWQLETANSHFWLVNILLRKFDTSSKKRIQNDKNTNFMIKKKKLPKKYIKALSNIFYELTSLTRDVICFKFRETKKYIILVKIYWCHFVRGTPS